MVKGLQAALVVSLILAGDCAWVAGATPTTGAVATSQGTARVKKERIGGFPSESGGQRIGETFLSPDLRHFACRVVEGGKWYMSIDGKKTGATNTGDIAFMEGGFSPDSKHFAYFRTADDFNHWVVIVDDKKTESASRPVFSPDSKRFAYILEKSKNSQVMVVDGKEGPKFEEVEFPKFSPDSKRFAYAAREALRYCAVVDGIQGPWFDGYSPLINFSPDSARVAYTVGGFAVIDGKRGPDFEYADVVVFSPDSAHFAYAAKQNGKWLVVRDGELGVAYDSPGQTVFSPDSKRLACVFRKGKTFFVDVDGQLGPGVDAPNGNIMSIEPVFSPDSKRLAYWAMSGEKYVAVIDGKALPKEAKFPTFGPDSQSVAWVERGADGSGWCVSASGKLGPAFEAAYAPVFSADGKHLAYFVRGGTAVGSGAVIDGQLGPSFDRIFLPDPYNTVPQFNVDGSISYVAEEGKVAYTVTQYPPGEK